jgi:hypothetical protein
VLELAKKNWLIFVLTKVVLNFLCSIWYFKIPKQLRPLIQKREREKTLLSLHIYDVASMASKEVDLGDYNILYC